MNWTQSSLAIIFSDVCRKFENLYGNLKQLNLFELVFFYLSMSSFQLVCSQTAYSNIHYDHFVNRA